MQQLIEPDTFCQMKMQKCSLPDIKYFWHMYLKTVKHLLRLFSSLKAGQLEISPSKKDNIHAWKSNYRQKVFYV